MNQSLFSLNADTLRVPAFTMAHSHAFQRAMRGTSQRRGELLSDDFWSWRSEMYKLVLSLTPDKIYHISKIAFREMRHAGVRTVGEFHYIHHQANGVPYSDRTLVSDLVIQAALEEGLRICLLRTAYFRAGPGKGPEDGQRPFCDPSPDDVVRDLETLQGKYAGHPDVRIGLAPHSVRAVPPEFLKPLVTYANQKQILLHMHVSEQEREVEECLVETGKRPVHYLDEIGALSPRFVAVHATRLEESEAHLLGSSESFVCLCPTTERDLGDGLPKISAFRKAKAKLCLGIDSHVITDPFEEMRSLETHERLRTRTRITAATSEFSEGMGTLSEQMWFEASVQGERACGFLTPAQPIGVAANHPSLELVHDSQILDAIVFSGHPGLLRQDLV